MAIIKFTDYTDSLGSLRFNNGPDHFVSEEEKKKNKYIKNTMDFYASVAYNQYGRHIDRKDGFVRNYDLMKGILRPEDFYEEPEVRSFIDQLSREVDLPNYVKHYPILNPPINTMVGEQSKRPDISRIKAFDDDSRNEELQSKTQILNDFIIQNAKQKLLSKLAIQGQEPPDEDQLNQLTMQEVQDYLSNYTSTAEKWANRMLTACKVEFNLKEISEDCFRDLLIASREFYHIYEDNSKTGFAVENLNPKNVWFLTLPDRKYISDPSESGRGAYAAGTIHLMELSEIIEKFNLNKDEIDHLRETLNESGGIGGRPSNFHTDKTGEKTITYDTYYPTEHEEKLFLQSLMEEDSTDSLNDLLGITKSTSSFGAKYIVIQAYYLGKQKIGQLTYLDENNEIQSTLVDETYEQIPNEINIEWGYINRWYKGIKIGPEVYKLEPLNCISYCPIIGVVHELKNSKAKSLVDLMKPLQVIYNICMNQLFKLLEKEIGVVYKVQIRRVPTPKDGDNQDALDIWEEEARRKGIIFEDDSPDNLRAPLPNTSTSSAVDLSRTSEIQSRYNLATMIKNECWELVGITRQRLGGSSGATESATATQTGLSQSYTQTEPYFAQHEYVLNQLHQAIVDMAQYKAVQSPTSTITYISNEGEQGFMKINTDELKMRDLKVFVTSRAEDQKIFEELRLLAQPMLQNGADPYDIAILYTTNSVRQMKETFKKIKDAKDAYLQQEQQMKQQELQQNEEQFQANMQKEIEDKKLDVANENYNKDLDRISKEKIAIIQATGFGKVASEDVDANGVPDVLEAGKLALEQSKAEREHQIELQKLQGEASKIKLEQDKLQVQRENMKNDEKIAKINAKNKNKSPKK